MKHAADPGAIADTGQRQWSVPTKFVAVYANAWRGDAIDHAAEDGQQVHQVTDRPAIRARDLCDLRIKSDAGTIRKKAIIHAADVDTSFSTFSLQALDQLAGRLAPVEGDITSLGKVVARSCGDNTKPRDRCGTHDAVDSLVNAAVTARDNNVLGTGFAAIVDLGLEIADRRTLLELHVYPGVGKYPEKLRLAPTGPAAASRRVEKQGNRGSGHQVATDDGGPMLQCRTLHAQKRTSSMLELGVKFLVSYFIGSLMGALLVGKLRGGVDIRTMGSGNAGGTNALRTQGIGFALVVVIVDVGKGYIGAGIVPGLEIPFAPADPEISRQWLTLCCAAAAVFGHVWPVFHHFRGGKGAATLVGTLIVLGPMLVLPLMLVWAWVLVMSGYVGLATMAAAAFVPIWIGFTRLPDDQPLFVYCVIMAGFIIAWHRSNMQRMKEGTEHRNTRLMIFSRKRQPVDDEQT